MKLLPEKWEQKTNNTACKIKLRKKASDTHADGLTVRVAPIYSPASNPFTLSPTMETCLSTWRNGASISSRYFKPVGVEAEACHNRLGCRMTGVA